MRVRKISSDELVIAKENVDGDSTYRYPVLLDQPGVFVDENPDRDCADDLREYAEKYEHVERVIPKTNPQIKSETIRYIDPANAETEKTYYMGDPPAETVREVPVENIQTYQDVMRHAETTTEYGVETINKAFYYPQMRCLEVWFDEKRENGLHHTPGNYALIDGVTQIRGVTASETTSDTDDTDTGFSFDDVLGQDVTEEDLTTEKTVYVCTECGHDRVAEQLIHQHIRENHPRVATLAEAYREETRVDGPSNDTYTCACGRDFRHQYNLQQHEQACDESGGGNPYPDQDGHETSGNYPDA